jgi:Flp pilus assembly protein TadD
VASLLLGGLIVARGQELVTCEAMPESTAARTAAWASFSMAVLAEQAGREEEALRLFREVAARAPDDPEVQTRIAACLLSLGRLEAALEQARQVTARDSTLAEPLWIEGVALVRLERAAEAIAPLRHAARITPATRTLDLLAALLEREGRDEELLGVLDQLARTQPGVYRLRRAGALERLGRHDEALTAYQELITEDPAREDVAERMSELLTELGRMDDLVAMHRLRVEARPEDRALRRSLAAALIQAERYGEAEAELKKLRAQDPDDPLVVLQLGLVDYRRGDAQAGMQHIDEAWRMAPNSPPIVRWRMRLQLAAGMIDSALASAVRLKDLRPADTEALRVEAIAESEKGNVTDALRALQDWTELAPKATEPLMMAASLLRETRAWGRALDLIRLAMSRAPQDTAIALEYASCLDAAGRPASADSIVVPLLQARPTDPVLLNFYGYLLVERGSDLARAESLLRRALELEPENPAILDSMGWLWYKKGRLGEAEGLLRRAIDRGGRHPEIFGHLARVQLARGRRHEAEQTIRSGLVIAPRDRNLQDLRLEIGRN